MNRSRTVPLAPHEHTFAGTAELAQKASLRRELRMSHSSILAQAVETHQIEVTIGSNIELGQE